MASTWRHHMWPHCQVTKLTLKAVPIYSWSPWMEASCVWTFRSNGRELSHRAGGMLWALGYDPLGVVVETWLIANDRLVGAQKSQTSRLLTKYAPVADLMQPLTWYWVIAKPGPRPLNQSTCGPGSESRRTILSRSKRGLLLPHTSGDFKKLTFGRCLADQALDL